jgi:hypothetical protein
LYLSFSAIAILCQHFSSFEESPISRYINHALR